MLSLFADFFIAVFNLSKDPTARDNARLYLVMIAVLLVLGAFYDICTQVLYSFFKQKVTNLLDLVVTILNPVLTLALVVWPFQLEVYGVMLALLITTVISVGIAAWQARLASKEAMAIAHYERELLAQADQPVSQNPADTLVTSPASPPQSLWRRFAKYALLMYFFNFSTLLSDASYAILVFSDQLLTVALIRLSYSFIKQLLKVLLTPFQGVQTPLFSSIHAEGQPNRLQAAYSSLTKLQIFILLPSAIGAIVLSRNLVQLLFPSSKANAVLTYSNLDLAVWVTMLTILFTFTESMVSLPMVILQVYERYRLVVISRILPLLGGPAFDPGRLPALGRYRCRLYHGFDGGWFAVDRSLDGASNAGPALSASILLEGRQSFVGFWLATRGGHILLAGQLAGHVRRGSGGRCDFRSGLPVAGRLRPGRQKPPLEPETTPPQIYRQMALRLLPSQGRYKTDRATFSMISY